jgi:hypothetical protein
LYAAHDPSGWIALSRYPLSAKCAIASSTRR